MHIDVLIWMFEIITVIGNIMLILICNLNILKYLSIAYRLCALDSCHDRSRTSANLKPINTLFLLSL